MSPNINIEEAVMAGDTPTVRRLIGEGVDVNANRRDCSPLYLACIMGNEEMVRILLEAGADKETVNIPKFHILSAMSLFWFFN